MKRLFTSLYLVALTVLASAQGLVIGAFDSGIDYTHPAFRDADGRLLISRVWEQGTDGKHPEGYDYGLELATPEAILAACADNTNQSHGTHTSSRALQFAGKEGTEMVLVAKSSEKLEKKKLCDAIKYIFDYAESVGKPCVINLSIGDHQGPHDGTSAFDHFIDSIVGPGRIIVGSAGNAGASTCHLSSSNGEPIRSFVIYRSDKYTQGSIDVWGTRGMQYSVQLSATQYVNGNVSSQSETIIVGGDAASQTYTWAPATGRLKGTFTIDSEISPLNGCPHAAITIDQTSAAMNYDLAVCITPLTQGTVHAWADDIYSSFHNRDREDFMKGDNLFTITEVGGTADSIISVGAMTAAHQIAPFCSIGPRLDGAVKPNVYAYGDNIESALNSYDSYQSSYPYTQTINYEGREYHYGNMSGTSMAAPMVTGIVGSWLRHNPRLTPGQAMALMDPDKIIDAERGLPTGILNVQEGDMALDALRQGNTYYDLQGRSVRPTRPGLYILNGRKVIIKQ